MSESLPPNENQIKVLIVDDSAFVRFSLVKFLKQIQTIEIVGEAVDGHEAISMAKDLKPDVITMDVEMPRLDGLSALQQIMKENPIPVVMLSSLTQEGAQETIRALTLGAVDFVAKPKSRSSINSIMAELVEKITKASEVTVFALKEKRVPAKPVGESAAQPSATLRAFRESDKLLVIGSSTGGPRALNNVVPNLPADLPAPILIVQHMPVGFTKSLADRLNSVSPFEVREAVEGDTLKVGLCLVAPGGFHMEVTDEGTIHLTENPPVHGVRPAVDVTQISVASRFGDRVITAVLTGMGRDGTNGASLIKASGGKVIVEDESTCVVWGMPRSVYEAGVADVMKPIDEIADTIVEYMEGKE